MKQFFVCVCVCLCLSNASASTFRADATAKGGQLLTVDQQLQQFTQYLTLAKQRLDDIITAQANIELVATDNSDTQLSTSMGKLPAQMASDVTTQYGGINVLAQFLSDMSETAGLDGTANEIRLYKNGVLIPVSQDQ